jgi:predicted peptidase
MKSVTRLLCSAVFSILFLTGCSVLPESTLTVAGKTTTTTIHLETGDIPQFYQLTGGVYDNAAYENWFCRPINYDLPENASRTYPLVIYFHGSSQQTLVNQCFYFGWEYKDGWSNDTAVLFKQTYPCFVYRPLALNNSWGNTDILQIVKKILNDNRIDKNRIYINGFSMGGFEAVNLANSLAGESQPVYCAALVIQAAGSVTISDSLKSRSSFWFMFGGKATEATAVKNLYASMKSYSANTGGTETVESNITISYKNTNATPAIRTSYTKGGKNFLRLMEFPELGHVISGYPYWDPETIRWIFEQKTASR